MQRLFTTLAVILISASASAADIEAWLAKPILDPNLPQKQIEDYCEARVLRMPKVSSAKEWEALAKKYREETLRKVVFRGEAAKWREMETKVKWLDTIEGGPEYRIRKLIYDVHKPMFYRVFLPSNLGPLIKYRLSLGSFHKTKGVRPMSKYEDTPAAIAMILFTLGGIFYVGQLLFMTEAWLSDNGIGAEAIGLARVLGFTWLGIIVVLIRTFTNGPAGTGAFFIALVIAQIGIFLNLWHQYFTLDPTRAASIIDDAGIVTVLTALLLFGWSRIRSKT